MIWELGEFFFNRIQEPPPTNQIGKDKQIKLLKIRYFCSSNGTIKRMKRQVRKGISNTNNPRGLYAEYIKSFFK